jgi:hypothetical protein
MTDADNHAGERSADERDPDQQKRSTRNRGRAIPQENGDNESQADAVREKAQKDSQVVKRDKNNLRTSRGPEDWGGYQGF